LFVMEVHFTPEQEEQIAHVAKHAGKRPELFVKLAVLGLLQLESASQNASSGSVLAKMRALRASLRPDAEGWTTHDYVREGRR